MHNRTAALLLAVALTAMISCLGTGLDAAMEGLVSLALESLGNEQRHKKKEQAKAGGYVYQSNEPLDVHQRYATKDEECTCWHPFRSA